MWQTIKRWLSGWLPSDDITDYLTQTLFTMNSKTMRIRDRCSTGEVTTLYQVLPSQDHLHTYFQVYSSRGTSLKGRVALICETYLVNNRYKTTWYYEIRVVYDYTHFDTIRVIAPNDPDTTDPTWTSTYQQVVTQALIPRIDEYGIGKKGTVMHPVMWYPQNTHSPVPAWLPDNTD